MADFVADRKRKVPVRGSTRKLLLGSREIGTIDRNEQIRATLVLRGPAKAKRRNTAPPKRFLTREEFETTLGADPKDVEKLRAFAARYGLEVVETSLARKTVVLSGTYSSMREAFGVVLKKYSHPDEATTFRGRVGDVYIPASLSGIVVAVLGLDDRPQARPHFQRLTSAAIRANDPRSTSFTPPEIARLYNFPLGVDGSGECIGIVELGGGDMTSDLETYFHNLGIKPPRIVVVPVDGAADSPTGNPDGPDGEVMLDIEIAGSIAPGASIALYFAPNTDRGFLDCLTTAIHDSQNKPSVISISWGSAENEWTSQATEAFNNALSDASMLGVTVTAASGDGGSSDGETDGLAHVDFPASSPFVLACGGTRLASSDQKITGEMAWSNSGGGVSGIFLLPSWQDGANVPPLANHRGKTGRGVPDVSGDADPSTGYSVMVDGQSAVFGGTSAVAPLFAALMALMNQQLGRPLGFINPTFYQNANAFNDITRGSNGAYSAGPGWDPCTGLGSPDGSKLLNVLGK